MPNSLMPTPKVAIHPFNLSELPTARAAEAWHAAMARATAPDTVASSLLMEHSCSALIRYKTQNFVKQAHAASELLNRILLNDNHYINIQWTHTEYNNRPFTDKGSYTESYLHNARNDASSEYCIVLQETEAKLSGVLGVALECGYCTPDWNVAYVSETVDDSLSTFVILHEISHLFCAKHSDHGVMNSITDRGNTLSGTSIQELYHGFVNSNWGGPTCMPSMNISAHKRHCHNEECSHHDDHHDDAYSHTGAVIFFTFVAFLFITACWLTCGVYEIHTITKPP